jgi:hypothetical protein
MQKCLLPEVHKETGQQQETGTSRGPHTPLKEPFQASAKLLKRSLKQLVRYGRRSAGQTATSSTFHLCRELQRQTCSDLFSLASEDDNMDTSEREIAKDR